MYICMYTYTRKFWKTSSKEIVWYITNLCFHSPTILEIAEMGAAYQAASCHAGHAGHACHARPWRKKRWLTEVPLGNNTQMRANLTKKHTHNMGCCWKTFWITYGMGVLHFFWWIWSLLGFDDSDLTASLLKGRVKLSGPCIISPGTCSDRSPISQRLNHW